MGSALPACRTPENGRPGRLRFTRTGPRYWQSEHSGTTIKISGVTGEKAVKTVARVLKSKSDPTIHAIRPDVPVFEAVRLMAEHNIGALLVMEGERVVGMVSERDYARKVVLMARSSRETMVRAIMSSPVMHVRPDQTDEECMALMTAKRVRHLPVMDGGKLVGLISIGDLVKSIVSEQEFIIEQLEHYIAGDRG